MSKFFQFCTFLFLGIILLGCSQQQQELKTAESLIETAPDSALHILQNLSPNKYKSGANRALYGLLMIQTLDKKLLPLKPDSLLDYSISYYEQNHENDLLATCYLYKGRIYKYAFQYEKAVITYLKALDILESSKNYCLLGKVNNDLGNIYLSQREYDQAKQKFLLSYDSFKKGKFETFSFYVLIDIGKTYTQTKDYKNANRYFKQAYLESKDSIT